MEIINAIILGAVQGLTEFLPISSSGHLVLATEYLKFEQPGVLFEALLHTGTMLAVVWYFRARILNIKLSELKLIVIATIPAAVIGFLFREQLESLFSVSKLVGVTFLISAFMNFQTDKYHGKRENLDFFDALVIGLFQAFAIIPAISRSGATIFAGSKLNIEKKAAAEFSFLISIPAVLGATVIEFVTHSSSVDFSFGLAAVGIVASFFSGLVAIHFLLKLLTENRFRIFGIYLVIIGVVTLIIL